MRVAGDPAWHNCLEAKAAILIVKNSGESCFLTEVMLNEIISTQGGKKKGLPDVAYRSTILKFKTATVKKKKQKQK